MTKAKAESITGTEIREIPRHGKVGNAVTLAAFLDGVEIIRRTESGVAATLSALVDTLYRRESRKAFEQQGWRCFVCGALTPLQADHIKPRARGRCDQRFNLRGVCAGDHQRITDNRIDPQPHPAVLAEVESHGWTWGPESNKRGWVRMDSGARPTLDAEDECRTV